LFLKFEIIIGNVCWWATKIQNVLDIKLIFLKLWIFTNFNTVFPVLVLVFEGCHMAIMYAKVVYKYLGKNFNVMKKYIGKTSDVKTSDVQKAT
jgi:Na+/glutamate symporter